jgi:hypothetical protein
VGQESALAMEDRAFLQEISGRFFEVGGAREGRRDAQIHAPTLVVMWSRIKLAA